MPDLAFDLPSHAEIVVADADRQIAKTLAESAAIPVDAQGKVLDLKNDEGAPVRGLKAILPRRTSHQVHAACPGLTEAAFEVLKAKALEPKAGGWYVYQAKPITAENATPEAPEGTPVVRFDVRR